LCSLTVQWLIPRDSPREKGITTILPTVNKKLPRVLGIVYSLEAMPKQARNPIPELLTFIRLRRRNPLYPPNFHFVKRVFDFTKFFSVKGNPPPERPRGSRGSLFLFASTAEKGRSREPKGSTRPTVYTTN